MNFNISDGQIFTQSGLSSNYRTRTIEVESIPLSGSQLPGFQTDLYLNLLIFFTDQPKALLWLTYKKSSTCIYKARFLFTRFNCIWHNQVFPATHLISAFTHSLGPTHANKEKKHNCIHQTTHISSLYFSRCQDSGCRAGSDSTPRAFPRLWRPKRRNAQPLPLNWVCLSM